MHGLVIGYGSIGKRHAQNLKSLGHDIIIVDNDINKYKQAYEDGFGVVSSIEKAFKNYTETEIVLICTDTVSHIPIAQTIATEYNVKGIFVEKPLSFSMDGIETLKSICDEKGIKLGCGSNLLYLSGIKLLKTLIDNNSIGNIISTDYMFSHNLKLWNPERDYRQTYSAGMGSGALLEDSHSITFMNHLFGNIIPEKSKGILLKSGILEIENEDVAESIHITDKNILCRIHSSLISPLYIRNLQIIGSRGLLQWEMNKKDKDNIESYVHMKTPAFDEFRTFNVSEPLNNMYLEEMIDYLNFIEGKIDKFNDGIPEMTIIDKIKKQNEFK